MAAAAHVRTALKGARSDRLRRLFDYLLERSLAGESPSEQRIAAEAFGEDSFAKAGEDANVRVSIYRLRKVLDAAFAGTSGPKLHVPVGTYRIRLVGDEESSVAPDDAVSPVPIRARLRTTSFWVIGLIAAALVLLALGWLRTGPEEASLANTLAWQPIAGGQRPLTVVVGDYYLFARLDGRAPAKDQPPQLVLDRAVPTREDLTILQMLNPSKANTVVDYNQQFVTGGTIEALSLVRASFARLPSLAHRPVKLVAASQLTPELLASSDIIYVGQFSGMTASLREPLAQASGFRIDPGFGGLTDAKTATHYQSDGMVLTDERIARRDFAYVASLPGPAGNSILMIAGLGDAGLKEAARVVGNIDQMTRLGAEPQLRRSGFEALYRVRTIKNVNVGAMLVLDRPLRSGGIWDNSGNVPAYRPIEVKPGPPTQR